MRGKLGIIVGLAAGYVLGARAGRERYEQIKEGAGRLWEMEPVQRQVGKVKDLGRSAALALPGTLWDGAVKVAKAAGTKGTPKDRLDATVHAAKDAGADVAAEAKKVADAAASGTGKAGGTSRSADSGAGKGGSAKGTGGSTPGMGSDSAAEVDTAEDVPSIEDEAEKAADS